MYRVRLKPVWSQILQALYDSPRVSALDVFLRSDAQVYVLAGAVRDTIAAQYGDYSDGIPRDFDIGVSGVKKEYFNEVLADFGDKNRHGGFVLRENGMSAWDIWRLEDSIGLRKTCTSFSLENVLRSFNLNSNALALDMKTGILLDAGAMESIRRRRIDFAEDAIRHSFATFSAKALLMQLRFGYSLSFPIQEFLRKHLEHQSLLYESRKTFKGLRAFSSVHGLGESGMLA